MFLAFVSFGVEVGLLDDGEMLPILKDDGDWLVVGLRGAAGWILKTDADKASQK